MEESVSKMKFKIFETLPSIAAEESARALCGTRKLTNSEYSHRNTKQKYMSEKLMCSLVSKSKYSPSLSNGRMYYVNFVAVPRT
jgi:hypothetical protein